MDLVILAIGLALGVLCCAVWTRVRSTEKAAAMAEKRASESAFWHDQQLKSIKAVTDAQQIHDHEIAALYDKAGMRRP